MIIKKIPAGVYAANCYLLVDEETKETAVIDPGGDYDDISAQIKKLECKVKYVFLTHGHIDHCGAIGEFIRDFGTSIYLSAKDMELMRNSAYIFGSLKQEELEHCVVIEEGQKFMIGNQEIICIETPGHSPGGLCFKAGNMLFSGDTLFLNSIGRSDLPGGDQDVLIRSIKEKLLTLGDEVQVYPGHGGSTNVKYEKTRNPYINGLY